MSSLPLPPPPPRASCIQRLIYCPDTHFFAQMTSYIAQLLTYFAQMPPFFGHMHFYFAHMLFYFALMPSNSVDGFTNIISNESPLCIPIQVYLWNLVAFVLFGEHAATSLFFSSCCVKSLPDSSVRLKALAFAWRRMHQQHEVVTQAVCADSEYQFVERC